MTSEIYLLDKKVDEIMKKLRKKKQKFWYPDNVTKTASNNINSSRTCNMQDTTLLFDI